MTTLLLSYLESLIKKSVLLACRYCAPPCKAPPPFFLLALQPPMGVVFYSPLAGFSLLACEVS